nr:molybdenum cofactor guanylyltransferase [uncultured Clostridium sp.]
MKVSAVLLAGGQGSRMNYQNKALLSLKGKNFLEIIISELEDVADEILISQQKLKVEGAEGFSVVHDNYLHCGPLSGIEAGLTCCENEILIVAACDMPMLKKELFIILLQYIEHYDAVIPIVNGKTEPLAAVYQKKILKKVRIQLQHGTFCVKNLLDQLNIRYIDVEEYGFGTEEFKNINTVKEYQSFLREQG